ncbi:MAG: site-specific DNA-methyltransferase, partial [Microscillaceae bacterium]|nr:site-specific DNA-methyltransferase [Microscillaceae bacterium]MDW8460624.1 site-specific DNA-methyltransferase [Cytophagales bacterium]
MTELIWQGKYKDGKKVAPIRIALPFQTIETINESTADQQKRLASLFNAKQDAGEWRNRLIWGDKKYVLPSLLPEFAGKVNLIYIDPPFNVGADFSFTATLGNAPDDADGEPVSFEKQPSILEMKAYRDTWGRRLDSYLQWFYETTLLLWELLAEDGSIYVHLDWHTGHYAKCILDEVFGYENFLNEIVWLRTRNPKGSQFANRKYGQVTDSIFIYSKSDKYVLNISSVKRKLSDEEISKKYFKEDEKGMYYPGPILRSKSMEPRPNLVYEYKGFTPDIYGWRMEKEKLIELDKNGDLGWTKNGTPYRKLRPTDEETEPLFNLWDDIYRLYGTSSEILNYPTQKPEALLERIIKASSNEGDLVLDCFCGSGTTAAVAEKLNRRWIACDLGRF